MHFEIAERLRPYSHLPGTYFMLPGSALRLQVFPALIKVDDLSGSTPKHIGNIILEIQGPVDDFTVQQDLEKGVIVVWGKSKKGFFRYRISALTNGMMLEFEKGIMAMKSEGEWSLHKNDAQYVFGSASKAGNSFVLPVVERLSLGNHKSQDWTLMQRRQKFEEILPIWHRLGQLVPKHEGSSRLLQQCRDAIGGNAPEKIIESFREVFLAGFDFGLSPRLCDTDHQGIFQDCKPTGSALQLLSEGADLIRSLFVRFDGDKIKLLPALPTEFHCGRFLSESLSVEWTKKDLRRVVFNAKDNKQITFAFSRGNTHCRLRTSNKDSGIKYVSGDKLDVVAGTPYWFDNFQK